jgi:hypothetical protein
MYWIGNIESRKKLAGAEMIGTFLIVIKFPSETSDFRKELTAISLREFFYRFC